MIPHIAQKKDFAYELPKNLAYKSKKVSASYCFNAVTYFVFIFFNILILIFYFNKEKDIFVLQWIVICNGLAGSYDQAKHISQDTICGGVGWRLHRRSSISSLLLSEMIEDQARTLKII